VAGHFFAVWSGAALQGEAEYGTALFHGPAGQGMARHGKALFRGVDYEAWRGAARLGRAWQGKDSKAR